MKFLVLWHHRTSSKGIKYQTTDVVECTPEELSGKLDDMRMDYLKRNGYKTGWVESETLPQPQTIAHQIILLS